MCDALMELMKDELEEAKESGIEQGRIELTAELIRGNVLTVQEGAQLLHMEEEALETYIANGVKH